MRLQSLQFSEEEGSPQEWILEELLLGSRNLIVGRNASGKTRTLNVIAILAQYLVGLRSLVGSGNYSCIFNHGNQKYRYELHYETQQVVTEKLLIDGKVLLNRREGGEGEIFAERIGKGGGENISFQSPTSELAVVLRRDAIQHSFLEPLYQWAVSVRHYQFGSDFGKNSLTIINPKGTIVDERNPNAVVGIFHAGQKEFPEVFEQTLIHDLSNIEYQVESIGIGPPVSLSIIGSALTGDPVGLLIKEKDLPGTTDQYSMSQGMFRVSSLLIHVIYFQLKKTATCVLVDDIGEGLDFDRSCRLIRLLREKAESSDLQIILSTNDRFVMNEVPLEEWSVLQRKGNHVAVRNDTNSHEIFEEFKFTGLSNFSFLELDILNHPPHDEKDEPIA